MDEKLTIIDDGDITGCDDKFVACDKFGDIDADPNLLVSRPRFTGCTSNTANSVVPPKFPDVDVSYKFHMDKDLATDTSYKIQLACGCLVDTFDCTDPSIIFCEQIFDSVDREGRPFIDPSLSDFYHQRCMKKMHHVDCCDLVDKYISYENFERIRDKFHWCSDRDEMFCLKCWNQILKNNMDSDDD